MEQPKEFLAWLESNGFQLDPRLVFKSDEDTGRGVWATEAIEEGVCLFAIPPSCVLSAATSNCPVLETEAGCKLSPWTQLAIVIIYEYCLKDKSHWYAYLHHFLPLSPSKPPTAFAPLFWEPSELALLQGSESEVIALEQRRDVEQQWLHAAKWIAQTKESLPDRGSLFTETMFKHVCFVIQSYSFTMSRSDLLPEHQAKLQAGDKMAEEDPNRDISRFVGMYPFADALNHSIPRNNARLFTGEEEENNGGTTEMISCEGIEKDHEVFNTYGLELPNAALLVSYGFMEEGNPFSFVLVSLSDLLRASDLARFPKLASSIRTLHAAEDASVGEKRPLPLDDEEFNLWQKKRGERIAAFGEYCAARPDSLFTFEGLSHGWEFMAQDEEPNPSFLVIAHLLMGPSEVVEPLVKEMGSPVEESSEEELPKLLQMCIESETLWSDRAEAMYSLLEVLVEERMQKYHSRTHGEADTRSPAEQMAHRLVEEEIDLLQQFMAVQLSSLAGSEDDEANDDPHSDDSDD